MIHNSPNSAGVWGKMDCLEFIARVVSHIPDKGYVTVRYYGLYANAHRGKTRKARLPPLALRMSEEELKSVPAKGWAAMIRKVYEVDPKVPPKCGGTMKSVALIIHIICVKIFILYNLRHGQN